MMDPMFDIPKGRKRISTGKVSLLLGMTVLLYLLISQGYAAVIG